MLIGSKKKFLDVFNYKRGKNMDIRSTNQNFCAKFIHTDSLYDVAKYAVAEGEFEKLNTARKNISKQHLQTRIGMDICYTDRYPTVIFSRYQPKKNIRIPLSMNDYELTNRVEYISNHPNRHPCKFALKLLVNMGKTAPYNKLYQEVVVKKNKNWQDILI